MLVKRERECIARFVGGEGEKGRGGEGELIANPTLRLLVFGHA